MSICTTKIAKLNSRELKICKNLGQIRENICTRKYWRIQYLLFFLRSLPIDFYWTFSLELIFVVCVFVCLFLQDKQMKHCCGSVD